MALIYIGLAIFLLYFAYWADRDAGTAATIGCTCEGILPTLAIECLDGTAFHTGPTPQAEFLFKRLTWYELSIGNDGCDVDPGTKLRRKDTAIQAKRPYSSQIHRRHMVEGRPAKTIILFPWWEVK